MDNKIKIYIEGGGGILNSQLRKAFVSLMKRYGIRTDLFNVVASGSRTKIYKDFSKIFQNSLSIVLLDSEKEIPYNKKKCKWDFLCKNENWNKPKNATEDNLFFMAACMESWIVADEDALQEFYGRCFRSNLPRAKDLSTVTKDDIMNALEKSTKECGKEKQYNKNNKKDSFKILEKVDVAKITKRNIYAKDFFEFLKQKQQENNT